jgi:trehalose 6-phosphate synthase/phosphatase
MQNKIQFKRLVIAAYRLPFKFSKNKNGYKAVQNSGGLVSAILSLSENSKKNSSLEFREKIVWAGVTDYLPEFSPTNKFQNDFFDIVPIEIPTRLNDSFYGGFCNDLIWPLFHYFPSYSIYNEEYFQAYKDANTKFCEDIVRISKPGDFIWIHDYHLMLLPEMIREKIPDATIGFFLHIPFPSFEIFRLLPHQWRGAIIHGLLGADLIGFHTYDYLQYFIKSVKRSTDFECTQNLIYTPNRIVKADAFPIGIDYDKFHLACNNDMVLKEKLKIKKTILKEKLIFSVDRLDYSKGLLLRLNGYETFLENYPEWHSRIVFNMVVVPSRDNIDKYKELKKEIESIVGRINGKYCTLAWRPVVYQYKSLSFNEMVALYDLSDVGLITPLRDGMNLVAKEYIACKVEKKGVLILSEMTGAASELNDALIINPTDKTEMAEAIYKALEMAPDEKNLRLLKMQHRISSYNVFTWANDFFNQTFVTKEKQKLMRSQLISEIISAQIITKYQDAGNRIFFLDYDGTLVSFTKDPEKATIDRDTLHIVEKLSNDSQNHVVIISGRDKNFLENQFKGIRVTLVAEHGYFIKKIGQNWQQTIKPKKNWKENVLTILQDYVNRCNGTFIEEKEGSIAWHYRNAEQDFAHLRLHELKDNLAEIIRYKTDFEILEGNKVLEVKSGKYNKGKAAKKILKNSNFDFILAAGDDITDELLFKGLPESACTIKVGHSHSFARYNVTELSDLLRLLNNLAE